MQYPYLRILCIEVVARRRAQMGYGLNPTNRSGVPGGLSEGAEITRVVRQAIGLTASLPQQFRTAGG